MSLSRRQFVQGVGVAGLGLVAGCGRLPGQAPSRMARLGFLASANPMSNPATDALLLGLADYGWTTGQTLTFEFRTADGHEERLPALAGELTGLQVDVLATGGDPATHALKGTTESIPIVMGAARDPVGSGLISSLARPGGNITGLSVYTNQLSGKRLELLKTTVPTLSRVAALGSPTSVPELREAEAAGETLGIAIQFLDVRGAEDFEPAFEAASRAHAQAVMPLAASLTVLHMRRIAELASVRQLPAIFDRQEFAEAGGLLAYGPNIPAQYRRAAYYVDRILKGAKPADLPVEQPREFDFVINLKTARALGLTIPEHVLLQATEVIQ